MNDELFADLLASVREGGEILRGVTEPARRFTMDALDVVQIREQDRHADSDDLRFSCVSLENRLLGECPTDELQRPSDSAA